MGAEFHLYTTSSLTSYYPLAASTKGLLYHIISDISLTLLIDPIWEQGLLCGLSLVIHNQISTCPDSPVSYHMRALSP